MDGLPGVFGVFATCLVALAARVELGHAGVLTLMTCALGQI